jgi:hypothetical protein
VPLVTLGCRVLGLSGRGSSYTGTAALAGDVCGCCSVVLVAWVARCRWALVVVGGWCHRSSSLVLKSPLHLSGSLLRARSSNWFHQLWRKMGLVGCVWDRGKPLVDMFDHDGGDVPWEPLSSLEVPSRSLLPTPISSSHVKTQNP